MSYVLMCLAGLLIGLITPPCWKSEWWKFALGIVAIFLAQMAGRL